MRRLIKPAGAGAAILAALLLSPASPYQTSAQDVDDRPQFRVESEEVDVPVVVIADGDRLLTGLKRENFRILEEDQPREISNFISETAPLTMVVLLEYSGIIRYIRSEVIRPAGIFVGSVMKPQDYAAIVAFDLKPEVIADFTSNRQKLIGSVQTLVNNFPAFNESNLFDALKFVLTGGVIEYEEYKGIAEVEGRTGVLLVATGIDTMSGTSFDEARRMVARAGVPIYSVGIGEMAFIRAEPYLSGVQRLTFLQAQNTLRSLSEESGGRFYSVRFEGAVDDVLDSIGHMMRHQYTLTFRPPSPSGDKAERREIEVLVDIDGDGRPDDVDVQHRKYYYR